MGMNNSISRRSMMLSAAAAAAGITALGQSTSNPPNFIVIYTDDQGIGDLGCYGAKDAKTPNLDRLAARGARFTQWYTNSPVCSPSRCALLTGQYPWRHGIRNFLTANATNTIKGLQPGARTLPGELRKLGYRTSIVGKWHLGSARESRPLAQGFDEHFGFYSGWSDYYSHRYYNMSRTSPEHIFHDLWRNGEEVFEDPQYSTEMYTREAKAFIERQANASQPFFLYLAHGAPHYPMIAPKKYLDRFPTTMDRERRMHLAMIAAVDDGIGEILDLLKQKGIDRDTVIFFQSDNGATSEARSDSQGRPYRGGSNAPYRGFKGGLFEGGIRMPALLSYPAKIAANTVDTNIGQTMDILPTFLEWAGAKEMPPALDGKAWRTSPDSREFYWEYQGQTAIRRGDWKLMLGPKEGLGDPVTAPRWLSNLNEDPSEKRNWLESNSQVAQVLEDKLKQWSQDLPPL
ncbi:hypothetical protein F183_A43090 [Bryobacterales bacterium F-183]|nr:hypothetical protein F183_A43090 [Bryobacterales bacterium F-183]